jgi:hypothetical protein
VFSHVCVPASFRYDGQAQQFTNAFTSTPQGKVPRFVRWSDLFDVGRLRAVGVDVREYHEVDMSRIHRAVLQTGTGRFDSHQSADTHRACKHGRRGLQSNLTWAVAPSAGLEPPDASPGDVVHAAHGELYGRSVAIDQLRCGPLPLRSGPAVLEELRAWLGDAPVAAVFDVGHHTHTHVADHRTIALVASSLRPNAELDSEAERAIASLFVGITRARGVRDASAPEEGAGAPPSRFVAVHWRHGDYVAYGLVSELESVIARVQTALSKLACSEGECGVFLMTNCRDESALGELRKAFSTLTTYHPSEPLFAEEGPRLLIEQAIAIRADAFVGNRRSAVSEFVETVRRSRSGARAASSQPVAREAKAEL